MIIFVVGIGLFLSLDFLLLTFKFFLLFRADGAETPEKRLKIL